MNTCPTFENWIVSFWGFCTSESSRENWPPRRETASKPPSLPSQWGEREEERVWSLGGLHIIVACVHTHTHTHTHTHLIAHGGVMVLSALCWTASARRSSSWNSPVPGLTAFMAPPPRRPPASPPPLIPEFPCSRLHCGGKQHKQTAVFSWAEGKLAREVKVNNIPCSLQWARDLLLFLCLLRGRGKEGKAVQSEPWACSTWGVRLGISGQGARERGLTLVLSWGQIDPKCVCVFAARVCVQACVWSVAALAGQG